MIETKYLTNKGYCKWCRFKHSHHPSFEHCKKMIDRALSRTRKDDNCHHCGHSKTKHKGKMYSDGGIKDSKMTLQLNTVCSHEKRFTGYDDNYCDCEVYL